MYTKFELEIFKILNGFIKPTHIQFVDQWMDSLYLWEKLNFENSSILLERLVDSLSTENPMLDRYYVLLAGLIVDIEPNLEKKLSIIKKATPQSEKDLSAKINRLIKNNLEMKNYLLCILAVRNKIRSIVSEINDEEKSAIIFLRNKYSHPVLSAYKVHLVKPDSEARFEFDMKKYLSSGNNLKMNEVELFDSTKEKLLKKMDILIELKNQFWEMRNGNFN